MGDTREGIMESTKEKIETLLKGFDPMFNRSDDFKFWSEQKNLRSEILQYIRMLPLEEQDHYKEKI